MTDSENELYASSENEQEELDPSYLLYLQNSFQDEIIQTLFLRISEYIKDTAVPICEHLTREDLEIIIQELSLLC